MNQTKLVGTFIVGDFDTLLRPIVIENLYEDEHVIVIHENGKFEKIVGDKKREELK